ncbi:MAG: hypothetical protein PHQ00_06655 [Phycisphaerae bacterium]|nr:hypothetical protein [Phycisphaerae bacterium]
MMKKMILLFVLMAASAWAANKYVGPTGTDDAAAGRGDSAGDPYATIYYAYTQASSGDTINVADGSYVDASANLYYAAAKNITIQGSSGVAANVVYTKRAGNAYHIRIYGNACTVTFKNMTIDNDDGANGAIDEVTRTANQAINIIIDNCIVLGRAGVAIYIRTEATGHLGSLTIQNGSVINNTGTTYCILVYDTESVTITDSSVTSALHEGIFLAAYINKVKITGSTLISNNSTEAYYCFRTTNVTSVGTGSYCLFRDNTVTSALNGIYIEDFFDVVDVNNNIFNFSNSGVGAIIGVNGDTSANPLGMVRVTNNTLTWGTSNAEGMVIGAGVNYGEVAYNKIIFGSGTSLALPVKGEGNHIHHNTIVAERCLYFKGGARNKAHNNTLIANGDSGSYCLQWLISTDSPEKNYITDNIMDASAGEYCVYISSGSHGNNYLNYNCYNLGSGGMAYDLGTTTAYATLALWKAQRDTWAATDLLWPENDDNSFIADPQFVNAAIGDFNSLSPLIWTGGYGGGYIGAEPPAITLGGSSDRGRRGY